MKSKYVFLFVTLLLLIDQGIKIYVKTHFYLNEEYIVIANWFRIHFIENEGMVFGWNFGGVLFKVIMILLRLAAGVFGVFILRYLIRNNYSTGLIVCASFVYAGALGNLIDNIFYGVIFNEGGLFQGKVVDMFYFPLIDTTLPSWLPVIGGNKFLFFEYIFNFADACIDIGVFSIIIFRKRIIGNRDPFAEIKLLFKKA